MLNVILTNSLLRLLFILGIWSSMGLITSQSQILQITEFDEDGNEVSIDRGISKSDINSYFTIQINRDRLAASQPESGSLNRQLRRVELLQFRLSQGLEGLTNLQQAYDESLNQNNRTIFQAAIREQAEVTIHVLELLRELNMRQALQRFDEALDKNLSIIEQYSLLFEFAGEEYTKVRREVEGIIERDGRTYLLGAWLIHQGESRPLSLTGFDTYPEQEFYRVDRFRDVFVNLSGTHENMLREFKDSDPQLRFESATDQLVLTAGQKFETVKENIQGCVTNFRFESGRLISEELDFLLEQRNQLVQEFGELTNIFDTVIEEVRSVSGAMQGISAIHAISGEIEPIESGARRLIQSVEQFADSARVRLDNVDLDAMNAVIESCVNQVEPATDLVELVDAFRNSGEANIEALEFGDEVIRHSLTSLPERTSMSLKRSGFREAGDMVVVKMASGKQEETPRDLAVRQIQLERVLPYLKLSPGIIYARPTADSEKDISGVYHLAPSYSVLLKFGSRRSSVLNRLIQPGIGINISALDMDGDNTPELGASIVGSVLKDYLQVGYGYNVNVQKGFFAFGLRLPLASMTLQGNLNE